MNEELEKIVAYMKAHWPSKAKKEWQVSLEQYPEILEKVLKDLMAGASQEKNLVRIAGLSGSGKTTQLLPAALKYFAEKSLTPILIAARKLAVYHPYYQEILEFYGEEKVRLMTDEFATIMMFLSLMKIISAGYDIILDVTLLDPKMEEILVKILGAEKYKFFMMMIAVSPEVAEKHLGKRNWRHTKETELEFIRATEKAIKFYAEKCPEMRIVLWNTYFKNPVYDGKIKKVLPIFREFSEEKEVPEHNEEKLREAKIKYFTI